MCSPAVCPRCRKVTWSGCGMHVDAVMAQIPTPSGAPAVDVARRIRTDPPA